jgi:alpha-1,4-N-acetylglucosaminyltransferase EXTL3
VKAHLQAQSDAARRTLGLISDEEWKRAGLLCPAAEAEMGLGFKKRLEEQFRVKQSVQVELRGLEKKGTELQKQVAALHRLIEDLKTEATRDQLEGERLRLSNRQEKLAQEEFTRRNTPEIRAPLSLQASLRSNVALLPPAEPELCGAAGQNCFDYSRCSLTSNFPIYVYDHESTKAFSWLLSGNFHLTTSPDRACVFLVFVEDASVSSKLSSYTNGLSHWNGDGRNHILYSSTLDLSGLKSRAMVAQPSFARNTFKMGFDIVTPFAHVEEGKELGEVWRATPDLLPLHRKYLVTFEGTRDNGVKMGTRESNDFDIKVLEHLKKIDSDNTDDRALIDYECSAADETLEHFALDGEIQLCHDEAERKKILMESTFVLVLAPQTSVSSKQFQLRLAEALR